MAKKFFNEKVPRKNNSLIHIIILIACVIGVIICFVIVSKYTNKPKKNVVIEPRELVSVEINSEFPDKTLFFSELRNVPEDDIIVNYDNVDLSKTGVYDVKITVYKKNYSSKLEVLDNVGPTLTLKDINIEKGYEYKASDFVKSCVDDSKEKCNIKFYDLATDIDGNLKDYSSYTENGEYTIQIIALDSSDNSSAPAKATLTIGTPSKTGDILCKYGKNEYNSNEYILATYITDNNCAVDLDLYNDPKIASAANRIMENDTTKLKKEFQTLNINKAVTLNRHAQAVINKDNTGIVGYTVHMEMLIDDEIVESYYVKLDGQRVYSINKYNLK